MSTYLLCATPIQGHVSPMVAIADALVTRGHDVTVLTGSRFRAAVERVGAMHRSLSGLADYDDRELDADDDDESRNLRAFQRGLQMLFIDPIPEQTGALEEATAEFAPDAILVDAAFAGAVPLLLDDPASRPPVLAAGVVPLSQSSADVAPYGLGLAPSTSTASRLRNRALNLLIQKVLFRGLQRRANVILEELGRPPLDRFVLDFSGLFDRFLQLSPEEFEYPRRDLTENVRFVGTVLPPAPAAGPLPQWWPELESGRPVVHVSQGTIDNRDFTRLIGPTLEALADRDVLVVAATGGRPVEELGELPANARAAEFLPYDALLPKTDVFVTNAGYGGVQYALSHGVPMVAAGDVADKPEVAMRVAWSGVGINLRSGSPDPESIRLAVDRVLQSPAYRQRAADLAARIAGYRTLDSIEEELAAASARWRP